MLAFPKDVSWIGFAKIILLYLIVQAYKLIQDMRKFCRERSNPDVQINMTQTATNTKNPKSNGRNNKNE